MKTIINQQIKWVEKGNLCYLETYYKDDKGFGLSSQPLTSEEASEWHAKLGGY